MRLISKFLQRRIAPLAVMGVFCAASIAVLFAVDSYVRYEDDIANARATALNFARIFVAHTTMTFENVDSKLREVELVRKNQMSAAPVSANLALQQLQKAAPAVVALGWTDASGEVVAHSYERPLPRSNVSEMTHFVVQRDNPDKGLFIAPPYRSAASGQWFTAASRRLNNPDGSFAGIITAPLDQSYFAKLYRSIDLGNGGSVLLLHRAGRILAREPVVEGAIGKSLADGTLLTQVAKSEEGSKDSVSPVDGIARIASYKVVPGLPLVVVVSYSRADILAGWYAHLGKFGPLVIIVVATILFGTYRLTRQSEDLRKQTDELRRKSLEVEQTNLRFEAALGNMPHGLSMFGADERLLVSNGRYHEMYGLTEQQVRPGTPLESILGDFRATNDGTRSSQDEIALSVRERVPQVLELIDGRMISIVRTSMKTGGWVSTHEDITEKRRAEALLAENAAELKRINDRFDIAISNMTQGLCLFDADRKLLISNDRFREIYDLTKEQVEPGTLLEQLLEVVATKGEQLRDTIENHTRQIPTQLSESFQLSDGRVIAIHRQPMPGGGWVATHQDITEQKRLETSLAEKAADLELVNTHFDAALNSMSQGLCLFDAEQRVVVSNLRYAEIYRLTPDQIVPGTHLREILELRRRQGTNYAVAANVYLNVNVRTASEVQELADGRFVSISRSQMPSGGWLTVHQDITERKLLEASLAEKAADLERMNACFDAALNNMSQGLCLFDGDQKVAVSNVKFAEIYRLDPDKVKPGTSRLQLLQYRKQQRTEFASDVSVDQKTNVDAGSRIEELVDGRFIAINNHRMSDGGWLTVQEDITERKLFNDRIAHLAHHDQLTGLANRARFADKLDEAAKRCSRHGTPFTVLMLDLDKFKYVNDTLGHPAGDQLLIQVAQRLKSSLRDTDVLARLGGDEFAIIQEGESNQREGAIGLALRMIDIIGAPFDLGGNQANIGTSIGIAFAPECGLDAQSLLKKADLALYEAKSEGRNDYRLFKPEMAEVSDTQKVLEGELREAIGRDEFELYYQPVIDAKTGSTCGVEALVRWRHPTRGLVLPDQFIPMAESTGLMMPLGEWILQQACHDAARWPTHIKVAVNISAVQFNNANIFDVVLCALVESGLSPERLELEITETMLLKNEQAGLLAIRQLKNLGIAIVLDDFGIGYSSSSYLTRVPFDKIKIDKSFVQGFPDRRECAAIVQSVLALARGLDMAITAEGVETQAQFESLRAAGVDLVQGYLFGRPVPLGELAWNPAKPQAKNVA